MSYLWTIIVFVFLSYCIGDAIHSPQETEE